MTRAALHYTWCVAVLAIYGGQVCPYIEGLGVTHWLTVLSAFFLILYTLRTGLLMRTIIDAPPNRQASRQFMLELGLFMAMGLSLTTFNMVAFDFPMDSGAKVIVGVLTLGFFASADLSLERERIVAAEFMQTGRAINPGTRYFPLTAKFLIIAFTSVLLLTLVIFLVISKDLDWLSDLSGRDHARARLAVLGELGFIAGVVLAGISNLLYSYSRNLNMFFGNENHSLKTVARGDFSVRVPVSTNDEFGVMGWYTNRMIGQLGSSIEEIKKTQDATILSLASLAEKRDAETGMHIMRTKFYVRALANRLKNHARFSETLTPENIELIHKSAPLHDIGKVGVPDAVLHKTTDLEPEEFEIMKRHPIMGGDALRDAEAVLGESSFLRLAREIAYSHHEKWDGSGYPEGLKGNDIPLAARLVALADVYDALRFERTYKPAFPHEEARRLILNERNKHFDPDVVDAFIEAESEFMEIAQEYRHDGAGATPRGLSRPTQP